MNLLVISGRIGKDIESRTLDNGKVVANFSLAVLRPFTTDKTDWFDVVLWDKSATFAANNLKKGEQVVVHGYIYIEQWEKDGVKNSKPKVTGSVEKFQWDSKPETQKPSSNFQSFDEDDFSSFKTIEDSDDIPF